MPPDTFMRSEAISPPMLGLERPIYDKHTVQIVADGKKLDVTIVLALDRTQPDELAASDTLAGGEPQLVVSYTAELDLKAEREQLTAELTDAYRAPQIGGLLRAEELVALRGALPGSEPPVLIEDLLAKAMMPVALLGRSVHRRLFRPDKLHHFSGTAAEIVRKALRFALRRDGRLAMRSPVQLFPWMFLYDDDRLVKDDRSTLMLDRFWGFRHEIQDEIEGTSGNVILADPPRIEAAVSHDVDSKDEHRHGALSTYARNTPEHVQWIDSAAQLRSKLMSFSGDCLYFFGHADQHDPPTPTTSWLKLNGVEVSVDDISSEGAPAFTQPLVLVFLNGCGTTPLNTWDANSFVGRLCCLGDNHVCCITSFAAVPQAFGRRFAQRFWDRFLLQRQTIGAALLHARCDLLRELNNPLGLLYTLFGRIETRLG